jgi:hypothetical protein
MLWSDKAFQIYMGRAGEETQVFVQEDSPVEHRSFDDTQVIALATYSAAAVEAGRQSHHQVRESDPKGLAA